MPRLRVLLDARKLGHGGIGSYTENLIAGMLEHGGVQLNLLCNPEKAASYEWRNSVNVVEEHSRPYSLDELFLLGRRIDQDNYDLFHVPHYTLPYGLNIPTVVTLHDLIHVYHPERRYYPYVAGTMIRSAVKRATRVIAVSNSTYCDLNRFSREAPAIREKVRVVPNALDPSFFREMAQPEQVVSRFHLRGRYLLAVCSMLKPHKGVQDLLRAFEGVQRHIKEACSSDPLHRAFADLKLVLVGQGTEKMVETDRLFEAAGSIKGVHIFGSVSKQELAALYASAQALVVPSLAEGFCLPVIEAQSLGTPVISRPVPAILELLSDDDVACADFSLSALRDGILRFLMRAAACSCRRDAGRASVNVRRFHREDVARSVLQIYHEAVSEFKGSRQRVSRRAD